MISYQNTTRKTMIQIYSIIVDPPSPEQTVRNMLYLL